MLITWVSSFSICFLLTFSFLLQLLPHGFERRSHVFVEKCDHQLGSFLIMLGFF
jgi:hypothetical protein